MVNNYSGSTRQILIVGSGVAGLSAAKGSQNSGPGGQHYHVRRRKPVTLLQAPIM